MCLFKKLSAKIIATLAFIGLSAPVNAGCSKEMMVAFMTVDPGYKTGTSTTPRGRDLEIFDQVMLQAGCSYTISEQPWKRVLNGIKAGTIDATISASYTAERAKFALFSKPFRSEIIAMFMRKEDIPKLHSKTFNDIIESDLNIGVHLGSWYGDMYKNAIQTNPAFRSRVLESSSFRFLHNWLLLGRVDIVLDDLYSGQTFVKKIGISDKVGVHSMSANENPVHFMFSKVTIAENDVDHINDALQTYLISPHYKKLIHRFSPDEY